MSPQVQLLITHLRVGNYKAHAELSVELSDQFSVIAGRNGAGKTSLLKAFLDAGIGYTPFARMSAWQGFMAKPDVPRELRNQDGSSLRFVKQFPVVVHATRKSSDPHDLTWVVEKTSEITDVWVNRDNNYHIDTPLERVIGQRQIDSDELRRVPLPLILFYPADRSWSPAAGEAIPIRALQQKIQRQDAYASFANASSDVDSLINWVTSRSLERLQTASERGLSFLQIDDDELAWVGAAIRAVLPEFHSIRYDMKRQSVVVEWCGSRDDRLHPDPVLFEHLSDGQRTVMALVLDIARRMLILNGHLKERALAQTPGLILIDELEAHLHPRWQRDIAKGLAKAFPSAQFIASTHSPQILSELRAEQILLLAPGKEATSHPHRSWGLTSNDILEEFMEGSRRNPELERKLLSIEHALEDAVEDIELANVEKSLAELYAQTGDIPDVLRLQEALAWVRQTEEGPAR